MMTRLKQGEDLLRVYFYDVLHKLYYEANRLKNDYRRQEEYIAKVAEYQKKEKEKGFVDQEEQKRLQLDIETAKKNAEEARKRIEKAQEESPKSPLAIVRKNIGEKFDSNVLTQKAEATEVPQQADDGKKNSFVTSGMSKLSRSERKLVSRILTIISDTAPKDVSEQIISKIKEELR